MKTARPLPTAMLLLALAGSILGAAACGTAPLPRRCVRVNLASMGPDNGFRIEVPAGLVSSLDDASESMDLAVTVVGPVAAPVRLVQVSGEHQLGDWQLKLPEPAGLSTRCSIGFGFNATCGAGLGDKPHPTAGAYTLDTGGNRILEAALSFTSCHQ